MKKFKYVLFLLIMLVPVYVNALDLSILPYEIKTNEGVSFYNYDDKFVAYVSEEYYELNLNTSNVSGFDVVGNTNIILNSDTTIQNFRFVNKEETGESIVIPFVAYKQGPGNQSIVLTDLEVVGYDLKYNSEKTDFVVNVPSNIDKVYINAVKEGNFTTVSGDGLVELNDKKTKVQVVVENNTLGSNTYTITIVKKNKLIGIIIAFVAAFLVSTGVLLYFFRKYQDKFSHVDPDILKANVKQIDVDEIIKQNAEKKKNNINDVSNETIKPGVLTPRTLIPEEDKK